MKDNINYKNIPTLEMLSVKNKTEGLGRAEKSRPFTSSVKLYKSEDKTILEGKKDIFVFIVPKSKSAASRLNLTQITTSFKANVEEKTLQENIFLNPSSTPQQNTINTVNFSRSKNAPELKPKPQVKNKAKKKSNIALSIMLFAVIIASSAYALQISKILNFNTVALFIKENIIRLSTTQPKKTEKSSLLNKISEMINNARSNS